MSKCHNLPQKRGRNRQGPRRIVNCLSLKFCVTNTSLGDVLHLKQFCSEVISVHVGRSRSWKCSLDEPTKPWYLFSLFAPNQALGDVEIYVVLFLCVCVCVRACVHACASARESWSLRALGHCHAKSAVSSPRNYLRHFTCYGSWGRQWKFAKIKKAKRHLKYVSVLCEKKSQDTRYLCHVSYFKLLKVRQKLSLHVVSGFLSRYFFSEDFAFVLNKYTSKRPAHFSLVTVSILFLICFDSCSEGNLNW